MLIEIIREILLTNNFKTNFFIENDVLNSKLINIFTFTCTVFINNCDVIVSIIIKTKFISQFRLIHAINTDISTRFEIVISIHKITIFDRDYMFKSKTKMTNLSIYVYIIDYNVILILIRNENDKSIHIFRNFRFENLIELNHFNVLQVSADHSIFIFKIFKIIHKQF